MPSRADEESFGRTAVPNPYTGDGPPPLNAAIDKLKRLIYVAISGYFLKRMAFYEIVMHSPHVSHEWFKIGLAASIALVGIKAYIELYEGHLRKQKVNYQNFKTATHVAILLLLLAGFAFHVALWPHYGWNTPVALMLVTFGVLLQLAVILPTSIQNLVTVVALTFFLQEYK